MENPQYMPNGQFLLHIFVVTDKGSFRGCHTLFLLPILLDYCCPISIGNLLIFLLVI
jgi:hypothetical protein